ncbi:MAG TPA: twin-arginine translocase TatA/TatE family subunit [Egicoccus sp.]|nr:twin-arginine translocase TatA/TatE family subunit [Egicoccus sp.]HSK23442.1 twin-arginine translocase TatA/TatE family subunit [Egicoccus sp.]
MPGVQELLVIAVVALLVFGPDRLPDLARNAARLLARFRSETQRGLDEFKRAADMQDLDRELRGIKADLDETRQAITRPFGVSTGRGSRAGAAVTGPAPRAADDPPPFDPEAT